MATHPTERPAVDADWVRRLPKAEVHLHLEGCVPHQLVVAAADRRGVEPPGDRTAPPTITSLAALLEYLDRSCGLIERAEDLETMAYELAERATASGAGYVDVITNPTHWPHWRGRLDAMVDALDSGFRSAEADGWASAGLCVSLKRTQSASTARELVDRLVDLRHPRVVGLSIDGDESGGSHNERFAEAFARAGAAGLRRCAHAGESSGADGVRQAIEVLGAERIDHGVRCTESAEVTALVVDRGVPLDICPTSNVVLGVTGGLATHPVEALRAAGARVSLNTDDPLLYGIDLAGEYQRCAATFGWGRAELAAIARTSIEASFADDDRRAGLLADLDAYLAAGPTGGQA